MSSLLARIEDLIGRLLLAAVVVFVFIGAVSRSIDRPIIWTVDMAQAVFVWLCFFGALKAMRLKAHIGVDYFVAKLPFPARRAIELGLAVLALAFLAAMGWFGVKLTLLNTARVFGDSGISYAWVTAAVPAGCIALGIVLFVQIVTALRSGGLVFTAEPGTVGDADTSDAPGHGEAKTVRTAGEL
ncbi:TRAP transporter small permease [Jiella sonneratiae]|uniref:TRAP transporter small permease protein n=1 Tax=Jiella sonneratiae TaxID=2816856 RepID=A0ABS3J0E1_9HYPH|nr:TRAP transporter small permease [Jiella sonneratiae]MBO0903126.1 TRAP transporter small permease [Jiella sonneratiae]